MWYQVRLPETIELAQLQFTTQLQFRGRGPDAPPPLWLHPRAYQVQVSTDGEDWNKMGEWEGNPGLNIVDLEPAPARFIRIMLTGAAEEPAAWSMRELMIYGVGRE